jgi:starch phosphorylase
MEASGTGNMKLAINGALTIGTNDGANLEMHRAIGDTYWPFSFGLMSHEIEQIQQKHSYNPIEFVNEHPHIKRALESLTNRTFAINEEEHQVFSFLYYHLLEGSDDRADKYFVLKDLPSYITCQKRVEDLYKTPLKWAEYALRNISGMGKFSVDSAVKKYANEIWHIQPCSIDEEIMTRVTKEYSVHDKCRIL